MTYESYEILEKKYSHFNLKEAVKEYARLIEESEAGNERVAIHKRICKLLGVGIDDFNPFGGIIVGIGCHFTAEMAESIINREINKIKAKKEAK